MFKVGDEVYSIAFGHGIVIQIYEKSNYPLNVEFESGIWHSFTEEGIFYLEEEEKKIIEAQKIVLCTKSIIEEEKKESISDNINHPKHYTSHPSGIECIQVTEHYNFCVGNAIKYLWRSGLKQEEGMLDIEKQIEDLNKAKWYIEREIKRLTEGNSNENC